MSSSKPLLHELSAWLPIAMSLVALLFVIGYITSFGMAQQPQGDEGVPARIFQFLIAGQVPIIGFFIGRWLHQKPRQAFSILVVQIVTALLACAPVFILEM